jgi:hypothetical protein
MLSLLHVSPSVSDVAEKEPTDFGEVLLTTTGGLLPRDQERLEKVKRVNDKVLLSVNSSRAASVGEMLLAANYCAKVTSELLRTARAIRGTPGAYFLLQRGTKMQPHQKLVPGYVTIDDILKFDQYKEKALEHGDHPVKDESVWAKSKNLRPICTFLLYFTDLVV